MIALSVTRSFICVIIHQLLIMQLPGTAQSTTGWCVAHLLPLFNRLNGWWMMQFPTLRRPPPSTHSRPKYNSERAEVTANSLTILIYIARRRTCQGPAAAAIGLHLIHVERGKPTITRRERCIWWTACISIAEKTESAVVFIASPSRCTGFYIVTTPCSPF